MAEKFPISSQNETTIDYPGKMAIIVFTPGCNFRCKFCHNPELIAENPGNIDVDVLLKNIKNRKNAGWYQGVCISGGEPTLHTGLIDFCKKLKDLGLSVKLDTNGTRPEILRKLLDENLVDYIAMDIKSVKEKYEEITDADVDIGDIEESIKLVKEFPFYEFRTTVLPFFDIGDFEEIGKWISENGRDKVKLFTVQQFSPRNTFDAGYMKLTPLAKDKLDDIANVMKKYAGFVRVLG